MNHSHSHESRSGGGHHHTSHSHGAGGKLATAFFLNLGFAVVEVFGGLWTNSLAILSDALHDAGDSASIGIAWILQKVAARESDATFTYGYRRFSTLGALITGVILLTGLVAIVAHAIPRLFHPEPVHAPGMIALATLGIVVNGIAAWRLRGSHSLNEQAVSWHLMEDVLGWAAVLVGSVAMMVWQAPILDPLLSIGISLFVLWNVLRVLKKTLLVFLQSAPASFDARRFEAEAATLPNVQSVHHTQSWSIDGERHVLSTHIVVPTACSSADVAAAKRAVRDLLGHHDFEHITIETERAGEECQLGSSRRRGDAEME